MQRVYGMSQVAFVQPSLHSDYWQSKLSGLSIKLNLVHTREITT